MRRGRPERAALLDSVFPGQHDPHGAVGDCRVGRVGRGEFLVTVVAIDLPEYAVAVDLNATEIMLAVRIIVGCETVECLHSLDGACDGRFG